MVKFLLTKNRLKTSLSNTYIMTSITGFFSSMAAFQRLHLFNILRVCLLVTSVNLFIATNAVAQAYHFSTLYEELSPTVVTVHTKELKVTNGVSSAKEGLGSGVMVSDELILTATHVINTANLIMIKFKDGEQIQADVITAITSADVALLKLRTPKEDSVVAQIGSSDSVKIGEPVFVIGAPFGIEHTLSIGHLSGRHYRGLMAAGQPVEFLQTDTAINTGNSGGPMFNAKGEVIGIVSFILSKSGGFNGIGFATAIDGVKESVLEGPAFWTGFEGVMLDREMAGALNVPQGTGMLVQHVVKGSVADKAGLKGGSTLAKIEGNPIWIGGDIVMEIQGTICNGPHNFKAIKKQIASLSPGEEFTIKVLRDGQIVNLSATQD